MKNNNLLVEYVKTIISELKLDRAYINSLLSKNPQMTIGAERVAKQWLKDVESYSGKKLSPGESKSIVNFCMSQYPKLLKQTKNNTVEASEELHYLLDLKFSALKLRLE